MHALLSAHRNSLGPHTSSVVGVVVVVVGLEVLLVVEVTREV